MSHPCNLWLLSKFEGKEQLPHLTSEATWSKNSRVLGLLCTYTVQCTRGFSSWFGFVQTHFAISRAGFNCQGVYSISYQYHSITTWSSVYTFFKDSWKTIFMLYYRNNVHLKKTVNIVFITWNSKTMQYAIPAHSAVLPLFYIYFLKAKFFL